MYVFTTELDQDTSLWRNQLISDVERADANYASFHRSMIKFKGTSITTRTGELLPCTKAYLVILLCAQVMNENTIFREKHHLFYLQNSPPFAMELNTLCSMYLGIPLKNKPLVFRCL